MTTEGPQSNQVTLFYEENDSDILLIEDVSIFMKRNENNQGPYYKFKILNTSSYKWMKVSFYSYFGLSLYIKRGSKPSAFDYDWVWHDKHVIRDGLIHTEYWLISAIDEKFETGDYYFWFRASDTSIYDYELLRINLSTWKPRYI